MEINNLGIAFPDDYFLEVESIADANKKLKDCKGCIKTLHIEGHASSNSITIGSIYGENSGILSYVSRIDTDNEGNNTLVETYSGFEIFKDIKFCKQCHIYLRGCETCKNTTALIIRISAITGCTVTGFKTYSYASAGGLVNGEEGARKHSSPPNWPINSQTVKSEYRIPLSDVTGKNTNKSTPLSP